MRNLIIILVLLTGYVQAQKVEVIHDEARATSYEGKSYLVIESLTIKPPQGGQFKVSAFTDGPFFIKIAEATKGETNIAPSLDQNFVRQESILVPGVQSEEEIPSLTISDRAILYKYIDGMGREIETVDLKASPLQRDVIKASYYDVMGHKTKVYLPYSKENNNGSFRGSYDGDSKDFYAPISTESNRPYSEHFFENSSLGREREVYGPGTSWFNAARRNQKCIKVDDSGAILRWQYVNVSTAPSVAFYDSILYTEIIDEENHVTREYEDEQGQIVLKRVQASGNYLTSPTTVTWHDTYFVYDDLGRLKIVVTPEAVSRLALEFVTDNTVKMNFLNRWCFRYDHDGRGNVIAKWIPGWTDWEYTVYDKWNRKILVQTPAQRQRNEWTFTKYDRLNREVITGLWVTSESLSTIRTNAFASSYRFETTTPSVEGYTYTTTYPTAISESNLIAITYYDNYDFISYSNWEAGSVDYSPKNVLDFPSTSTFLASVVGYQTGRKVRVLEEGQWLNSVTYYDGKYNVVQSISKNFIGGYDCITSDYNFIKKPTKIHHQHISSSESVTLLRENVYDHSGLLLKVYQTVDNGPRTLIQSNEYDEIKQLTERNIHSVDGESFLQSIDYRYNIRGWLSSINNSALSNDGTLNNDTGDLFGMEFLYNPSSPTTIGSGSEAFNVGSLYDGSIVGVKWKINNLKDPSYEQIYGFSYDTKNRLNKAYYAKKSGTSWTSDVGFFNEAVKAYDANGNIQGIQRFSVVNGAKTLIDSTYYNYRYAGTTIPDFQGVSNRVWKIKDSGNSLGFKDATVQFDQEFNYDASGNVIYDNNKQISNVVYNHLNLPRIIEFTRSDFKIDRLIYTYDALGTKIRMQVWQKATPGTSGTRVWQSEFCGDFQYDQDQNSSNSRLTFINIPDGRLVKNVDRYDFEYFYKDHQGNIRLAYGKFNQTISYKATMEEPTIAFGDKEEQIFKNVAQTRYLNQTYNYTKSGAEVLLPQRSSQTNGTISTKRMGPAKMLSVASGDKVSFDAFAIFSQQPGSTATISDAVLFAATVSTFGLNTSTPENLKIYNGFQTNAPIIPNSGSGSQTVPHAYMAYLFFDSNYNFVRSGAKPISSAAFNSFERLQLNFSADQQGTLYLYLINETNVSSADVYFDEVQVVHQQNTPALQVAQSSDYYPFGLSFNYYRQARISEDFNEYLTNRYGFQGQHWQSDLDLNWSQFKWRMYDPAIGRFTSIDPLSEKFYHNSTFAFSENKVTGHIELEGLESVNSGFFQAYLWKDVGYTYRPNAKTTQDTGVDLLKTYLGALGTVMLAAVPFEEAALVGGGLLLTKFPRIAKAIGYSDELAKAAKTYESSTPNANTARATKNGAEEATSTGKELSEKSIIEETTTTVSNTERNVVPAGNQANHIFSGKNGKLPDTPQNRQLLTDLTNNPSKRQGVDPYGKTWYAEIQDDGTQLYAYTQNGMVKGAGVNDVPLDLFTLKSLTK